MIFEAVIELNPTVKVVTFVDEVLVALDSDGIEVPIDLQAAELKAAGLVAKAKATEYQRLRAAEYPPMSDYLDGVVKGDQAQVDKYVSDCLAVKAKYPKPE